MAYDDQDYAQQELEQRRRYGGARPTLRDRIADDAQTRQSPDIGALGPQQDVAAQVQTAQPGIAPSGPPKQPSLVQRVLGGFSGQPGGGGAGLAGQVARGAVGGLLGPTQRQDIEAERLGSQRIAGEHGLEAQREQFALPEQQARISQQEAGTEQQRLATKILQRRLELMSGGQTSGLQDLNDDENALLQSAYATGDPKQIEQAVGRIYSRRSIEGMVGPGTNVYDQNAPGGVSRQFMTRGGQPGPTVQGAVVPGTLPRTQTSEQLVPTAAGGMAAVGKSETTTPQLPGAPRAGGGGGVRDTGVQPRLPAQEQRTRDTAGVALQAIPDIAQQMKTLRDRLELGPLSGRVQELRNTIGNADPVYTQLRTNIDLMVSALSVMHFGARGNIQWLNEFKKNADQGALNYDNLRAGLGVMEKWIRRYQQVGEAGSVDDQISAPGVAGARR